MSTTCTHHDGALALADDSFSCCLPWLFHVPPLLVTDLAEIEEGEDEDDDFDSNNMNPRSGSGGDWSPPQLELASLGGDDGTGQSDSVQVAP